MKRFFRIALALMLALVLSGSLCPVRAAGEEWDELVSALLTELDLPGTLELGYYNTVTGEEHYYNGDELMVAASLYKVPLNMIYSERLYEGTITAEQTWNGRTYPDIQSASLTYSNNPYSELLLSELGGWKEMRRLSAEYMGEDPEDETYLSAQNRFCARQITRAMAYLQRNSERFPGAVDCLQLSAPGQFLEYADVPYDIAQKYGNLTVEPAHFFHASGIVFTDEPIVLTVMTLNVGDQRTLMSRYVTAMCEYAQTHAGETPEPAPTPATEPESAAEAAAEPVVTAVPAPTPAPEAETAEKSPRLSSAGFFILSAVAAALCIAAGKKRRTALLLALLCVLPGALFAGVALPLKETAPSSASSPAERIEQRTKNDLSFWLQELSSTETLSLSSFFSPFPESMTVAPAPSPEGYVTAEAFDELEEFLRAAEPLLDGDGLMLGEKTSLRSGTKIEGYRDESILALCWQETWEDQILSFAEVKFAEGTQLRRKLSGDEYGCTVQKFPTELAQECNAVLAVNADFYRFQNTGIHVYDHSLYMKDGKKVDTAFFDGDGNMTVVRAGELTDEEAVCAYQEENDFRFSVSFGPLMVENGECTVPEYYWMGQSRQQYPRCCISQLGERHYLIMTVHRGCSVARVAEYLISRGITYAYAVDGGQSGAIVLGGKMVSYNDMYGSPRTMSDILYFATAVSDDPLK